MERIRIERKPVKRRVRPDVPPLDPRDPDIVRAKALPRRERQRTHTAQTTV